MKIVKVILALALAVAATASAQTQTSSDDALWADLERESQWSRVTIEHPGLKGQISGFVTDKGEVKLGEVGPEIISETTIQSPTFAKFKTTKRYLQECENLGGEILAGFRRLKNPFTVRMPVFSARSKNLNLMVDGRPVDRLATTFQELGYFKVEVVFKKDSYSIAGRSLDAEKFQNEVLRQIEAQRQAIQTNGHIDFDFTGLDEVACDLVAGRMQIRVLSNMHYSQAKLLREPRISTVDFSKVYGRVKGSWQDMGSAKRNMVMAGVKLGAAVERELQLVPALSDDEILKLHDILFESGRNRLRLIAPYDMAASAARMDKLSRAFTWSNPVYQTQVLAPLP